MKIVFLADRYLPHAGGSRVYYHNVYSRLANDHGDDVTVITKDIPGAHEFDAFVQTASLQIIRRFLPLDSWKYYRLHTLIQPLLHTMSVIRRVRPDIIHSGDVYPQGVIAMLLKMFSGIPYVAYCHGEEITQMEQCRCEPIVRDAVYKNADAVIAASEFARRNLLRIGVGEDKIRKVTPAVDLQRISPGSSSSDLVKRFSLGGQQILLTVGRLVPRKGHETVLRAVAILAKERADVGYLIVGTGPEHDRLRRLAWDLGITDVVRFAGYVPDAELFDFYRLCQVMVMPNYEEVETGDIEGFGMVFLEANAAAKPVIAGQSGGTAEAVIDGVTGYLCDPHNVGALVALLRRLLNDIPLAQRLGQQGYARVCNEFNWDTRADAIHSFCVSILEHGNLGLPSGVKHRRSRSLSRYLNIS